jgi:transcriptional regulator with XRE-family HTH domain
VNTTSEQWKKLRDKEYRQAFAVAQFKRLVPFQIRSLRKNRELSQEKLADLSALTQGVISRAEDSDYGNLTVNTILKIANGFDVAFVGRFVPFTEFDDWYRTVSEENIQADSFEEEDRSILAETSRQTRPSPRNVISIEEYLRSQRAGAGADSRLTIAPTPLGKVGTELPRPSGGAYPEFSALGVKNG